MEKYNTMNKIFQNKEYFKGIYNEIDMEIIDSFISEASIGKTWGRTYIMPTNKYWLGTNNIGLNEEISERHISELREYLSNFFNMATPANSAEYFSMMHAHSKYNRFLKIYDTIQKHVTDLNKAEQYLNFVKMNELPCDLINEISKIIIN